MILATNPSYLSKGSLDSAIEPRPQATITKPVQVRGIGFVRGADVQLRFLPAPANHGVQFIRTDLPSLPRIPAKIEHLCHDDRRTGIAADKATVEMTEHVLAALAALDIDNCDIHIDASETPAMDGSSRAYTHLLRAAGRTQQDQVVNPLRITERIAIDDRPASIQIHPTDEPGLRVTYELEYANPGIGSQRVSLLITPESFERELAAARTFVLAQEVEFLRSMGIGTRQNACDLLVFRDDGSLVENVLRFPDECCRHKILDIIGDLALLGRPIIGHVIARRSGHRHTVALAKAIAKLVPG